MSPCIPTRCLVLSDTHGDEPALPHGKFDVVLHCGDLTEESKLDELKTTLQWLRKVDAPLKLVIAGNHDFTLDTPSFQHKIEQMKADPDIEDHEVKSTFGGIGEARTLFEDVEVKGAGIVLLDEGTHRFKLANGAVLTVYASPYTPSLNDNWGFTFHPEQGHDWSIKTGVDVVMTHGPPRGILDYTDSKTRAGCPGLFSAIARAQPQLHCFGHLHEGWGAKKVTWRSVLDEDPTHFTAIDNDGSKFIETLAGILPRKIDTQETKDEKKVKLDELTRQGHCHATGPIRPDGQTMFINAASHGDQDYQTHLPWTVDLDLPRCSDESESRKRSCSGAGLTSEDERSCKKRSA